MNKWLHIIRNYSRFEQKLDTVIMYIDFLWFTELPIILLRDGSLEVVFKIDGLDYEGISEEDKEQCSHFARTAMELLPDEGAGFMVSNLLIRDTSTPIPLVNNPDALPLIQFIQEKKQAFWNDRITKSYSNSILCGLRYFPVNKKEASARASMSDTRIFTFYEDELRADAEKLEQGFLNLKRGFKKFGFRELDRAETFKELYYLINFSPPPPCGYRKTFALSIQLGASSYKFNKKEDYFVINDTDYISVVGIKIPPALSVAMYLRRFYELDFPMILRQSIGFRQKDKVLREQDRYLPIAQALSAIDAKNLRYIEEVMDMRDRIEKGEFPVWWHFTTVVRAKNKEDLRKRKIDVVSLLKEIGSTGIAEKRNLKAAFFSTLPGLDRFYTRRLPIMTGNIGDFFSAYALSQGDIRPVEYLQDQLKGVFAYNPFTRKLPAHHRIVAGPTAGGKSFFVIKDLISHLITNPMIWVVDLSVSYLDFFELLQEELPNDTAIMQVSRDNASFAFNPFLIKDLQNPEIPEQQFEFCLDFLKLMVGEKLCTSEAVMDIQKGLEIFFTSYRVMLKTQTVFEPIPPLGLLSRIMETKLQNKALSSAIAIWTTGRRGALFNSGRNTLQDARYCYFDLRDLDGEPELTKAIVYVIFSKVNNDIADESQRFVQKRFVLDEAHRYIGDPIFAPRIDLIIRAGRHWNIMLDIITQSINDVKHSTAIMTNLKQAFFFPGMKDVEDAFQKLHMNEYNIQQYKTLDPSRYQTLYWNDAGIRRILQSVADPYTYWLATTNAEERALKKRMKAKTGSTKEAIEKLVEVTAGANSLEERTMKLKTFFGDQ